MKWRSNQCLDAVPKSSVNMKSPSFSYPARISIRIGKRRFNYRRLAIKHRIYGKLIFDKVFK